MLIPAAATLGTAARGYRLSRAEPNAADSNSAVTFSFQLPSREPEEYALLEILAEVLEQVSLYLDEYG